ncbi:MAG: glucose-6-phosphate dehydrogenase [Bacilli bacterium]
MSYTIVIFGSNGDLSYRKLLPALYNLKKDNVLKDDITIVGIGRREYDDSLYHQEIYKSLKEHSRLPVDGQTWNSFKSRIFYYNMDFNNPDEYNSLNLYLNKVDEKYNTNKQRIYYLAVSPEYFGVIVDHLKINKMNNFNNNWPRVVIEKPFGRDLKSAQFLNNKIVDAFTENRTYRIDHYLGKEMLQNIMVIRFANSLFEPIWNSKHIQEVQITASETVGVGTRGGYYESSGAIRDMAQSHLLQLICLIAMEKPKTLEPEDIKNEKVHILNSLKDYKYDKVDKYVIRGQYEGYRNEVKVDSDSNIETFVAFKTYVNNERWKDVPFYIRTGKKLPEKTTEIVIKFKEQENNLYKDISHPNYLVIRIQPKEGVFFQFNAKDPGTIQKIVPVQMDFCQNCQIGNNSPEAYERLFYDIIRGDLTLFSRWDEVESSWKFIDKIMDKWNNTKPNFPNYKSGTWGPDEADLLLKNDNTSWITFTDK